MTKKITEEDVSTKIALALIPHMRDVESGLACIDFFDKLFKDKVNGPYQEGQRWEYFSRGHNNNPKWRPCIITKCLKYGRWNNMTPQQIEITLLDNGSTRIIDIRNCNVRLRKPT